MTKVKNIIKDLQRIREQRQEFTKGDDKVQKITEHFTIHRHHYSMLSLLTIIILICCLVGIRVL